MNSSTKITLDSGAVISVFTLPYFLASKMEAFWNRGEMDFIGSKDLEDMITVIDGREDILVQLLQSNPTVLSYLKENFQKLYGNQDFIQSLTGHMAYHPQPERRSRRLLDVMQSLT